MSIFSIKMAQKDAFSDLSSFELSRERIAPLAFATPTTMAVGGDDDDAPPAKSTSLLECFPYVCPEPVLVKMIGFSII